MKKKIILCLMIIVLLFISTSCNQVKSINNTNESNNTNNFSNIEINDILVDLDMTSSFNDITYKYPSKAMYSNVGTYAIIDLMNNDDLLVRVALSIYKNKNIDEVMKGSSLSKEKQLIINSNTWNIYNGKQDDGKSIINYVIRNSNDTYSIAFISDKDINDFISLFMSYISFK